MNRKDFLNSLSDKMALFFWKNKTKDYIAHELGQEVAIMKDFNQRNPHHCYTLMDHCLHAVDNLSSHGDRDAIVKTAAFFHDMGKPIVAKEKEGRLVFYGHAQLSAKLVVPVLTKLGYEQKEINDIKFLVYHHDDFISYVLQENYVPKFGKIAITENSIKSYYDKLKNQNNDIEPAHMKLLVQELIDLAIADVSAQSIITLRNGKEIDSRAAKVLRIQKIGELINTLT